MVVFLCDLKKTSTHWAYSHLALTPKPLVTRTLNTHTYDFTLLISYDIQWYMVLKVGEPLSQEYNGF